MARKTTNENGSKPIKKMSTADLYALYLFVSGDRNLGFNAYNQKTKIMVDKKVKEIEEELRIRAYGCNPFVKTVVIDGVRPEDIDLDKIKTNSNNKEKEGIQKTPEIKPETFVVLEKKEQ